MIIITSPINNQTYNTKLIDIKYDVQRNGMLYLLNSTTTLINATDNNILSIKYSDLPYDKFVLDTPIKNLINYYILKITSYGTFINVNDRSHEYMNIEDFVNFTIDLSP